MFAQGESAGQSEASAEEVDQLQRRVAQLTQNIELLNAGVAER